MSIFRREHAEAAPPAAGTKPAASGRATYIAPGSVVHGEITGATELLIDGTIEGEIRVEAAVVVGAEGVVAGPIEARTVRVGGRVIGDVRAADRVDVVATGSLEGNIAAPRIAVAEGAFFKGKVEMKSQSGQTTTAPRQQASGARSGD